MVKACEIHRELSKVLLPDQMAHWYSDLYAKVTPESKEIINQYEYKHMVSVFNDQITHTPWYEIPFCYNPLVKEGKA